MNVAPHQRFSRTSPCPICGGCDQGPRGAGQRCYGFLSDDGRFAHCTREELAGTLSRNPASQTFAHRLEGRCGCGQTHRPMGSDPAARGDAWRLAGSWDYWSGDGDIKLYQVCRHEVGNGKSYSVRRPAPPDWRSCQHRRQCRKDGVACANGWIATLKARPCSPAVAPVLYNLPLLTAAQPGDLVAVAEGEKDTDALCSLGFLSTTNPFGAGKWRPAYSKKLTGAAAIFADADRPGRNHARQVARSLRGEAKTIKIVDLYPDRDDGSDVADWIAERRVQGLGDDAIRAELDALIAQAPEWRPEAHSDPVTSPPATSTGVGAGGADGVPQGFSFSDLRHRAQDEGFELCFLPFLDERDVRLICSGFSTLMAAYPKSGKTSLLFPLARHWATEGHSVLYFTEEPEIVWKARLVDAPEEGMERMVGVPGLGADPATLLARAAEGDEDIVIVDTTNVLGIQDGNDSSTVWAALTPWVAMARARGKTIIFAHHTNKSLAGDLKAVAGSYNFAAIVDCVLLLRPDESPTRRVLGGASRIFAVEQAMYELRDGELRYLGEPSEVQLNTIASGCLAVLGTSPGERKTTREILEALEEPRPGLTWTQRALALLAERGEILREPPVEQGPKSGTTYRWWLPGGATSPHTIPPLVGGEVQAGAESAPPMAPKARRQ